LLVNNLEYFIIYVLFLEQADPYIVSSLPMMLNVLFFPEDT